MSGFWCWLTGHDFERITMDNNTPTRSVVYFCTRCCRREVVS